MGGLPKKAFKLETVYDSPSSKLLIDAGALLFAKNRLSSGLEVEQAKITAAAIVESYSKIGYEAVGIARQDLAGGLSFLKEQATRSSFPWLSANLVDRNTQEPIFTPYLILQKQNMNIGIIGLTGHTGDSPIEEDQEVEIVSWQKILPPLLSSLENQCDIILLLSNLPHSENQMLSKQFNSIHLVIQSGITTSNMNPFLVNNTLIFQTEKQGKHLGMMDIHWHPSKTWQREGNPLLLKKQNELDRLNWQIKRIRSKGNPEMIYKDKPENIQAFRNIEKKESLLRQEIALEKRNETPTEKQSTYQNVFIPIQKEFPDQAEVATIVDQAKIEVNSLGKKRRANKKLAGYTGSQSCKECHIEQYDNWQSTRHAKAHKTLVAKSQQFNVDCLPCHVTGIEVNKGHMALSLPEDLLKVGCESCHGPGQDHAATPEQSNLLSPPVTVCLQCHTEEHDDDFDFKRDRQLVH
ncbi:MAG: hypothetical protein H8E41_01440 [Desulfobulbaceae bacterium]|uniref:Cytochrome c-552/4 domain-containing protein n=1 Tax=Candidatus Desulfobia pelagia TaxID=2841692 RepID=A0A8J6NCX5_9BACT|nr:hypothetical protein [Candidatus Desulfobia pelagia]